MSKNDFGAAIKQLQSLAGHSSEQFETIKKGLLAMAENLERDTHFQGFAELVAQELKARDLLNIGNFMQPLVDPPIDFDYEKVKHLLAQYAYDLVLYTVTECHKWDMSYMDVPELMAEIPDFTPQTPESSPAPEP